MALQRTTVLDNSLWECALKRKLADAVVTGVRAVDHVVVADMQPVRVIEYLAPPKSTGTFRADT